MLAYTSISQGSPRCPQDNWDGFRLEAANQVTKHLQAPCFSQAQVKSWFQDPLCSLLASTIGHLIDEGSGRLAWGRQSRICDGLPDLAGRPHPVPRHTGTTLSNLGSTWLSFSKALTCQLRESGYIYQFGGGPSGWADTLQSEDRPLSAACLLTRPPREAFTMKAPISPEALLSKVRTRGLLRAFKTHSDGH